MSEMAKSARAAMRAKATRLSGKGDPHKKVDASSWEPTEPLNTTYKTGARPVRPRIYKHGGKVQGDRGPKRADSLPRQIDNAKVNRNVPAANAEEFGKYHEGGFRKGGSPRKKRDMGGGMQDPRAEAQSAMMAASQRSGTSPNRMDFGNARSGVTKMIGLKKGGRSERKSGGRTKAKTNINIVIAAPHGQPQQAPNNAPIRPPLPPPMPPPPMPQGLPPGGPGGPPMPPPSMAGGNGMPMPMPRQRGGRTKMTASAASGEGRLQKMAL